MRALFALAVAVAVTACQTMTPAQQQAMRAAANQPVFCIGTEQCQIRWSRALQWVKQNSTYRFDQATDSLISTKGPSPNSASPAFVITKIARGADRFDIDFDGGCDNFIGCVPTLLEEKASFATFVMAQ